MPTPAAPYPISPVRDDELPTFVRMFSRAFGDTVDDDAVEHQVATERGCPALAAHDGDRMIGTTTARRFSMTVPGGAPVDCAGVTAVSVQPTHRRRGVLTSLMRRQLDDLHETGTAWAALYASEAAIYGRYGYGVASRSLQLKLDGPWRRFATPVAPAGVAWVEPADAAAPVSAIYEQVRAQVPGMMSRTEDEWRRHLGWDPEGERGGASARQVVLLEDRGMALYRVTSGWDDAGPDGTVDIESCMATDAGAERQLWAYLLNLDLVQHVRAWLRPVDEPLPWWLAERRRLQITEGMSCYLRLVDVGAALSQRGAGATGAVVLDVSDPFCPWNTRRWRLEGDGASLHCTPTTDAADLSLDARELASLSLGGVSPHELHRAGLIGAHTPHALGQTRALLQTPRPPWNPFIF